jgi:hypothetical protein
MACRKEFSTPDLHKTEGVDAMAYVKNANFAEPQSGEARIWRYSNLTKFVSLLDSGALYFSGVAGLNEKFDPFEGTYTRANLLLEEFVEGADNRLGDRPPFAATNFHDSRCTRLS